MDSRTPSPAAPAIGGTRKRPRRFSFVLAGLILGWASSGCELADEFTAEADPSCQDSDYHANVGGTWRLVGEGRRSFCSDEALDTDFELDAPSLTVRQDGLVLSLVGPADGTTTSGATGSGGVNGTCVEFTYSEPYGDNDSLTLIFSGSFDGERISGTLSGNGPDGCIVDGSFSVRVECCEGTGPPPKTAGDASADPNIAGDGSDDDSGLGCQHSDPAAPWSGTLPFSALLYIWAHRRLRLRIHRTR